MDEKCISNVESALAAGKALGAPITGTPESVIVIPSGYRAEAIEKHIEQYLPQPRRLKANVRLANADSFIAYVAEYKTSETKIFATVPKNNGAPSFLAILDYHNSVSTTSPISATAIDNGARWCEHRASYDCVFTEEWTRWMSKDRVPMSQVQFATFLEENAQLITAPPGAELLELVQTLEGRNNISIGSTIKLSNGRVKFNYEEDVELKGSVTTQQGAIEVPPFLMVAIQAFYDGPAYAIKCRLRYRVEQRKVTFHYECVDVHLVVQDVVKDVVGQIKEKLKITPLNGSPA